MQSKCNTSKLIRHKLVTNSPSFRDNASMVLISIFYSVNRKIFPDSFPPQPLSPPVAFWCNNSTPKIPEAPWGENAQVIHDNTISDFFTKTLGCYKIYYYFSTTH